MSRLSQDNTFIFCSKGDSNIYVCVNYYDKQTTDFKWEGYYNMIVHAN